VSLPEQSPLCPVVGRLVCSPPSLYSVVYPLDVYVISEAAALSHETRLSHFLLLTQRQDSHSSRDKDEKFRAADGDVPLASCNFEERWHLGAVQGLHGYDGEHVLNAYVIADIPSTLTS
jgi:hypothetical protein